jgi:hypothetical protein
MVGLHMPEVTKTEAPVAQQINHGCSSPLQRMMGVFAILVRGVCAGTQLPAVRLNVVRAVDRQRTETTRFTFREFGFE